jgi:hypothetical protein
MERSVKRQLELLIRRFDFYRAMSPDNELGVG